MADFFAFFVVLFLCFNLDLIFFLVICSFQHVIGWKLRKIVRDLMPSPKPNSFYDDVMQVLSLAPSIYTKSKNLKNGKIFSRKEKRLSKNGVRSSGS